MAPAPRRPRTGVYLVVGRAHVRVRPGRLRGGPVLVRALGGGSRWHGPGSPVSWREFGHRTARGRPGQRPADPARARRADRVPGLRAVSPRQRRLPGDARGALGPARRPAAELACSSPGSRSCSGSIWGKPTWGMWWTWDARLTSTTASCSSSTSATCCCGPWSTSRSGALGYAAVVGILGAVNIPIVHFSVKWWRALHQPSTILGPEPSPIAGDHQPRSPSMAVFSSSSPTSSPGASRSPGSRKWA